MEEVFCGLYDLITYIVYLCIYF